MPGIFTLYDHGEHLYRKLILEKRQVSSIIVIEFYEFFNESKHPILYFIFFFGVVIPFRLVGF